MNHTLEQQMKKDSLALYLTLALLAKIIIIFSLPITGDEAYFFLWAKHLDLGYYDHPPMVGWVLWLVGKVGGGIYTARFLSFATSLIVAYQLYQIALRYTDSSIARHLAALFIVSPVDLLISLFTNDIPLLLFGTTALYYYFQALHTERTKYFLLITGIFLGLAFLSKYFVVLLIAGIFVHLIYTYKFKSIVYIVILTAGMLPFVALNLYYNYTNCWTNIVFNFVARPQEGALNLASLSNFALTITYLMTPWGIYLLAKSYPLKNGLTKTLLVLIAIPFFVLLSASMKNEIGLHWLLLFVPLSYLFFINLSVPQLQKMVHYNFYFSVLHFIIVVGVLLAPLSLFKEHKKYKDIVMFSKTDEICKQLSNADVIYAADYTITSILSYNCKREMVTIASNTKFGRAEDKWTDYSQLAGKTLTIFQVEDIFDRISPYFSKIEQRRIIVGGTEFKEYTCYGFDFEKYKNDYIIPINKQFYKIPSFFPIGGCFFKKMYGLE
jgi:Dolichyl-phosphate-mannose-protein mannosyltransferase